ncbi:helix-turn-helix domain-containing protein [Streptomyces apocyni]|uniref:helix-turn-helix domain-containing protein n=1 Tax=Streptomyces apocyni TaxID=2654677 RepID=UPI001E61F524|nr:helix-turn-helix domain-containing protein [Streptomyces apocyni]
MFAETSAATVARHRHPAWKVVLPVGGHVTVGEMAAAGVLVPPQLDHACATSSAFVAVFLEPWCVRPGLGLSRLESSTVRRLLDALGEDMDLAALHREVSTVTGEAPVIDPRVAHAVRVCGQAKQLDAVATEVGLSPPRLRALVRSTVGVPLARLRQWRRLRTAVAALPGSTPASAAAVAGFADQAHLTRVTRELSGRTPGSLKVHAASGTLRP